MSLKYERIADELEAEIRQQPPAHLPSERALTERFGVDRSTIRRAMLQLEQKGLILRRPGRRTQVLPREVRRPDPPRRRIALVMHASPQGWATFPVLHGVESTATALGYELTFCSTHAPDQFQAERREAEQLERCLRRGVSGVILWPAGQHSSLQILHRLSAGGIPGVLLDQHLEGAPSDFVGIDNVAAAYRITRHFIQSRRTRIAHISRSNSMPTTLQRIEGFRRALQDHGIAESPDSVLRCAPGRDEEAAIDRLLNSPEPPNAIFVINDLTAIRVMQALIARGVDIPGRIALAGIDDLAVDEFTAVTLTSIHQPFEEMGAAAARLLIDRIEGRAKGEPLVRLLPTHLVVRGSCGASAPALLPSTRVQ